MSVSVIPRIQKNSTSPMFPLTLPFVWIGVGAGVLAALATVTPIFGFGVFVLFVTTGMLWRHGEPPVLSFCLGMQWIGAFTGYAYYRITGIYPGQDSLGDIDRSVLITLLGLIALAVGLRLGMSAGTSSVPNVLAVGSRSTRSLLNIARLFWFVVGVYTINWFVAIAPMEMFFSAAQIIYNVLNFRVVLLFLLMSAVFRQRRGYRYLVVATLYVLLPQFASIMSGFKDVFFLVLLAMAAVWYPAAKEDLGGIRRSTILAFGGVGIAGLLLMGLIWEGGLKPAWRTAVSEGEIASAPTERLAAFVNTAQNTLPQISVGPAVEGLVQRLSPGPAYFSFVLTRVPEVVAHQEGALSLRAINHVLVPRLLNPEKVNLSSDSWLVRDFAGLNVAGAESGTSIGLGYIPEFYIDFGVPWMFVPLLLYGLVLSVMYQVIGRVAPSPAWASAAITALFTLHFQGLDGELAKQFGGMLQTTIMFALALVVVGPRLNQVLLDVGSIEASYRLRATAGGSFGRIRRAAHS